MIHATVAIDPTRVIGESDPMIYGQYLEHVSTDENCIYGVIQDDGSPLADADGYRLDVIEAVRELQVPVVRWPGGCFADIYHWEDGIGPRSQRPVRRNWHWGGLESNQFGTDEFLHWCQMVDTVPYLNFNLGTGTLNEAIRWLDYCNGSDPTSDVRLRQQNGQHEPYGVPLWGIGNEQWGNWEAGHMNSHEYAAKLHNWAQFLRKLDPKAQFLGIGSHSAGDPEWDLRVLETAGHLIDYLTLHMYGHTIQGDSSDAEYYATVTYPLFFEERMQRLQSMIEIVTNKQPRTTPLRISLDEWNIRHLRRDSETGALSLDRSSPRTLSDALFVAGVFNAMLRLAPAVGMGCYVFLLNGNAIMRVNPDGVVRSPLFDVFQSYRQRLHSTVLNAQVRSDEFWTAIRQRHIGESTTQSAAYVDVVATRNAAGTQLALALINRHRYESAEVRIDPQRFACVGAAQVWELYNDDVLATNDSTRRIEPYSTTREWTDTLTLRPHSVTIVQVATEPSA